MWKYAVAFLGGLAVGAGGVYIYGRRKYDKKVQEEVDAVARDYKLREVALKGEIAELRAIREADEESKKPAEKKETKKFKTTEKPEINDILKTYESDEPVEKVDVKPEKKKKSNKPKPKKKIDYDDHYEDEEDAETVKESKDAYNNFEHPEVDSQDIPYSITPEQFSDEKEYYDKVTLLYYEEDDILATEYDEQVNAEAGTMVGLGFAEKFGEFEEDVAFIRNDRLGTDYEILLQHCSYHEKVLGTTEE